MDQPQIISKNLNIPAAQVAAVIKLFDEGNTLPFIARYRKEMTGGLDEEQIRSISESLAKLRAMEERRETILRSIQEQGKLTEELLAQLTVADTLTRLEDLYAPYKPKRRTRASVAKDRGLQTLADWIIAQPQTRTPLEEIVAPFLNDQVPTEQDAWSGARDIVAEMISDHADIRRVAREKALKWGILHSEKIPDSQDEKKVFESYYEFNCVVDRLRPHQVLALNRAEAEKVIRVRIEILERDWRNAISAVFCPNRLSPLADQMVLAVEDAAERLLLPAIERDVRHEISEKAEQHAISIFASNLRALLLQPPISGQTVLGLDPGFRTGSKIAVVDPTGKLLETATIYPHEPQRDKEKSLKLLRALIQKHQVTLIAIGNGTASRETEQLVAEMIRTDTPAVKYAIVSEAGASVYSASPLARQELPALDVSLRGAVSIARRIQDPLAELVKIDPKSIGVGLYQHDVDQKQLENALIGVVESVVNTVGVDVNSASPSLLTYVAGIGPKLAERIVAYRDEHGRFANRQAVKQVNGLGPKAFEQSAGFLRIHGGDHPLDNSAIHPESYAVAKKVLQKARLTLETPAEDRRPILDAMLAVTPLGALAVELDCGIPTLKDILEQLVQPGRDPRQDAPLPILRSDVLKVEDLVVGMKLKGTVRNVVDFGAFVDIGIKQDGLLHRSQLPMGTVIRLGDILEVEILKIEAERGRISLGWVSQRVDQIKR
jgi:uncharacterized protein